jgi:glutathione peroxidase
MANVHDFTVPSIRQQPVSLSDYRDKVLLIVNTASRCGLTPQYAELQSLYERYRSRGFEVLAFPCDQFAHQEPGDNAQIENFCTTQFSVTFPIFDKIDVNGKHTAPLFDRLKKAAPGLLGTRSIKWNFTKFLVSRDGEHVQRFAPRTSPLALADAIERRLAQPLSPDAPADQAAANPLPR